MPDGMGGAGIGAGGGAVMGAVMYALNQFLGAGRAIKTMDTSITEWRKEVDKDLENLVAMVRTLHDWHSVADPEDPAGKIWYFGVAPRRILRALDDRVGRLVDLTGKVVDRFDQYNKTTEQLITVIESLKKDIDALGLMVGRIDRGGM